MRGEVLYYDETQGFGFITGADGNRYTFAREDLRRQAPMGKGTVIEFVPAGGKARDVFSIGAQLSTHAGPAPAAPASFPTQPSVGAPAAAPVQATVAPAPHYGRNAEAEAGAPTGLWSYFWRGLTANYFNFAGRARRKEYWGYHLFWGVAFVLVVAAGLFTDGATGYLADDAPYFTVGLSVAFVLATFLPGLGMTVRRFHDVGMSGWFVLLFVVLSIITVGGLVILVITLIPTQDRENKWGPVPAGVTA